MLLGREEGGQRPIRLAELSQGQSLVVVQPRNARIGADRLVGEIARLRRISVHVRDGRPRRQRRRLRRRRLRVDVLRGFSSSAWTVYVDNFSPNPTANICRHPMRTSTENQANHLQASQNHGLG